MKPILPLALAGLVLAAVPIAGCDNLIEEDLVSEVTAEYFSTPAGLRAAVSGAYVTLRVFYAREQGSNFTVLGTDQTTYGSHHGAQFLNNYTSELNGTYWGLNEMWEQFYRAINLTNTAIGRAEGADIPEAEKQSLIAQAKFLRAHYYYLLVQTFGGVTLKLEETTEVETTAERASEQEVYAAVVADLEAAIADLGYDAGASPGLASEPAAKNMLALVLLSRSYTAFAEGDDARRAAELAESVINDYDFALASSPAEAIVNRANETGPEVIWSVQYNNDILYNRDVNGNDRGNEMHLFFRPFYHQINPGLSRVHQPGGGRPWIRFKPTTWALENFRAVDDLSVDCRYHDYFQDTWTYNDPNNTTFQGLGATLQDTALYISANASITSDAERMAAQEAMRARGNEGAVFYTWTQPADRNDGVRMIFPALKKFDDWERESVNYQAGGRDFIVYRLSETYLIAAEARLKMGQTQAATDLINVVRRRAACEGVDPSALNVSAGAVDLDFLLDERARELYGEQKRWFDLKRTGTLVRRVRAHNPDAAPNIQEYHTLRPIPTNQRDAVENDYPQNPGY